MLSLTNTGLAYAFTLPAMLAIDPGLTIAAIALYPVMLGSVRLFGGRMMHPASQQENLAGLSELIQEDLSGIAAIKIYGQEALNWIPSENAIESTEIRPSVCGAHATLFPLLEGISSLSLLLVIALGSGQLEEETLTIGGLVALILYWAFGVSNCPVGFLRTFQTRRVSLERVEELLSRRPRICDHDPLVLTGKMRGELVFRT